MGADTLDGNSGVAARRQGIFCPTPLSFSLSETFLLKIQNLELKYLVLQEFRGKIKLPLNFLKMGDFSALNFVFLAENFPTKRGSFSLHQREAHFGLYPALHKMSVDRLTQYHRRCHTISCRISITGYYSVVPHDAVNYDRTSPLHHCTYGHGTGHVHSAYNGATAYGGTRYVGLYTLL